MQRASDGWWENSHPTDLCGKLSPPHCRLIGLWEGATEEEEALQEQFNEGMLKKSDVHNEFYPIEEWPIFLPRLDDASQRDAAPDRLPTSFGIRKSPEEVLRRT